MTPYLLILVVLLGAWAMRGMLRTDAPRRPGVEPWPFVRQKPLSRVEQVLYFRLVHALPGHVVLAQVPLSRILKVRKGQPNTSWMNRIDRKSVDFLICRPDFAIVTAIELDDASHRDADRQLADATKNRALAAGGIPLVRWRASELPDAEAIRAMISAVVEDASAPGDPVSSLVLEPVSELTPMAAARIANPIASNDPMIVHEDKKT